MRISSCYRALLADILTADLRTLASSSSILQTHGRMDKTDPRVKTDRWRSTDRGL